MSAPHDTKELLEAVRAAADSTTADRVFGSPVTTDGVVLLPVARVAGGGGGGGGEAGPAPQDGHPEGAGGRPGSAGGRSEGSGAGGGFGTSGRGLGVFAVKDGQVTWHPAVDVNRIVLGGQLVAITALLVLRGILRARRAHGHPAAPRISKAARRSWNRIGRRTR